MRTYFQAQFLIENGWLVETDIPWALARASMLIRQAYSTLAATEAMRAGAQSFSAIQVAWSSVFLLFLCLIDDGLNCHFLEMRSYHRLVGMTEEAVSSRLGQRTADY
jgi:hypothetical protein